MNKVINKLNFLELKKKSCMAVARRTFLLAQGALSGNPILLRAHQKDQISVSLSLGISATSVEGLMAPDCRKGLWGQIHPSQISVGSFASKVWSLLFLIWNSLEELYALK